jgi:hypothetical protein
MIVSSLGFGEGMVAVFGDMLDGTERVSYNLFVDEPVVLEILFSDGALVLKHLN